jgi:type VI secretion system secreted protein Hcp
MERLRLSAKSLALIAIAILVAAGTYAVASIPGSDGVITACWDHTAGATYGALRVIDPSLSGNTRSANEYSCQSNETQLTWNQQGPTGPVGPAGPLGPQGPAGPQGPRAPSSILSFTGGVKTMFLTLPGITGESKVTGHKGQIELQSWSFGATQPKPKTAEIIVVKRVDSTSPKLALADASGKPFDKVKIELAKKKGGKLAVYLRFTMHNVLISSVKTVNHGGDKLPSEQVSFNFAKIEEEYVGTGHTTIHLTPHQIKLP